MEELTDCNWATNLRFALEKFSDRSTRINRLIEYLKSTNQNFRPKVYKLTLRAILPFYMFSSCTCTNGLLKLSGKKW